MLKLRQGMLADLRRRSLRKLEELPEEDRASVPIFQAPKDLEVPDLPMSASTTRFLEAKAEI